MEGEKYTMLTIQPLLEAAVKREIVITKWHGDTIDYYVKGARAKSYIKTVDHGTLLIPGWNHPLTLDTDLAQKGRKNCFNFVTGVPAFVRDILKKNVNHRFDQHDRICYRPAEHKQWLDLFEKTTA